MLYNYIITDDISNTNTYNFISKSLKKNFIYDFDYIIIYSDFEIEDILDINNNDDRFISFIFVKFNKKLYTPLLYNFYISEVSDNNLVDGIIKKIIVFFKKIYPRENTFGIFLDINTYKIDKYLFNLCMNDFKFPIIVSSKTAKEGILNHIESDDKEYFYIYFEYIRNYVYTKEIKHEYEIENYYLYNYNEYLEYDEEKEYSYKYDIDENDEDFLKIKNKECNIEYDKSKFILYMLNNLKIYNNVNPDPKLLCTRVRFDTSTLKILNRLVYGNYIKIPDFDDKKFIKDENNFYEFSGKFRISGINNNLINLEFDNVDEVLDPNLKATSKLQIGLEDSVNMEDAMFNFHSHPYIHNHINYVNVPSFKDLFMHMKFIDSADICPISFISSHYGIFSIAVKSINYADRYNTYINSLEFIQDLLNLSGLFKDYLKDLDMDEEFVHIINDNYNFDKSEFYSYTTYLDNFINDIRKFIKVIEYNLKIEDLSQFEYMNEKLLEYIDKIYDTKKYEVSDEKYIISKISNINTFLNSDKSTLFKINRNINKLLYAYDDKGVFKLLENISSNILVLIKKISQIKYDYDDIELKINIFENAYDKIKFNNQESYKFIMKKLDKYLDKNSRIDISKIIDEDGNFMITRYDRENLIEEIYNYINIYNEQLFYTKINSEMNDSNINDILLEPFLQYNILKNNLYHRDKIYKGSKFKKNKLDYTDKFNRYKYLDRLVTKMHNIFIDSVHKYYPKVFNDIFELKFLSWYRLYKGDSFEVYIQPQFDNNVQPNNRFLYNLFDIIYDKVEDSEFLKREMINLYLQDESAMKDMTLEEYESNIDLDENYDPQYRERNYISRKKKELLNNIKLKESDNYTYRKSKRDYEYDNYQDSDY